MIPTRTSDVATQLSSWDIDIYSTRTLARVMSRRTNRALVDAMSCSVDNLCRSGAHASSPTGCLERLNDLTKDVEATCWTRPLNVWLGIHIFPERFLSPAEIKDGLSSLEDPALKNPPPRIAFGASTIDSCWLQPALAMMRNDLSDGNGASASPLRPAAGDQAPLLAVTNSAIGLLEAAWPEAEMEMHELVRQILFIVGDGHSSAYTIHTHGAIYLSASPTLLNVPTIFENLLHETGHHALTLKESFTRMLLNSEDRTESPLRTGARPVRGVFHALFVITRIIFGIERALQHVTRCEREALEGRLEFLRQRRGVGIQSLERSAKFTDQGRGSFRTCY